MLHLFTFFLDPLSPFPHRRISGDEARVPGRAAARRSAAKWQRRRGEQWPRGSGGGEAMERGGGSGSGDEKRRAAPGGAARRAVMEQGARGAEWSGSGATRSSLGSPDGSSSLQLTGTKSLSPLLADACCSAQRRRAAALLSWLLPHTGVDESLAIP